MLLHEVGTYISQRKCNQWILSTAKYFLTVFLSLTADFIKASILCLQTIIPRYHPNFHFCCLSRKKVSVGYLIYTSQWEMGIYETSKYLGENMAYYSMYSSTFINTAQNFSGYWCKSYSILLHHVHVGSAPTGGLATPSANLPIAPFVGLLSHE